MSGRAYEFHRSGGVIWSLVFEQASGRWYIEQLGRDGNRVRLTLNEFENGSHGRRMSGALAAALHQAEQDA